MSRDFKPRHPIHKMLKNNPQPSRITCHDSGFSENYTQEHRDYNSRVEIAGFFFGEEKRKRSSRTT
ncbi:MAG: hypothetical protein ACLQQ0_11845, partial [Limisphaerales bacterium]